MHRVNPGGVKPKTFNERTTSALAESKDGRGASIHGRLPSFDVAELALCQGDRLRVSRRSPLHGEADVRIRHQCIRHAAMLRHDERRSNLDDAIEARPRRADVPPSVVRPARKADWAEPISGPPAATIGGKAQPGGEPAGQAVQLDVASGDRMTTTPELGENTARDAGPRIGRCGVALTQKQDSHWMTLA